jgi:hypothetical protein
MIPPAVYLPELPYLSTGLSGSVESRKVSIHKVIHEVDLAGLPLSIDCGSDGLRWCSE